MSLPLSDDRPLTWVVGAGGLVGSHVTSALSSAGHEVLTSAVPWEDEDAAADALADGARRLVDARRGRPWAVAWCAGAGVVATGEDALVAEVRVFGRALDALEAALAGSVDVGEDLGNAERVALTKGQGVEDPGAENLGVEDPGAEDPGAGATDPEQQTAGPGAGGVLLLASSAGGLYAGCAEPPFDESTVPRPLVAYGRAKLAMESRAAEFAQRTGARVVLGRLANVYGPGQRLGKPQGLLSQLCLADATGRPLPVYVSLDTIRDYLYVGDAARMIAGSLELARDEPPGAVITKVLASGHPVTVGYAISEARRVFHRRLRTVPVGGAATGQVLDLRLRSQVWPALDSLAATTLASGLDRTAADVRARVVAGGPIDG